MPLWLKSFAVVASCLLSLSNVVFAADVFTLAKTGTPTQMKDFLMKGKRISKDDLTRALHIAAGESNYPQVLRMLVDAGADVNDIAIPAEERDGDELGPDSDMYGSMPINDAASAEKWENVKVLLKVGADPDAKDFEQVSLLQYAAMMGNDDIVMALLQAGADPAHRDISQRKAYDYAVENPKISKKVCILLKKGY